MTEKGSIITVTGTILLAMVLVSGCGGGREQRQDGDRVRAYANALYNRELYRAAITEYQRYLDLYDVKQAERGNINFIIADIYFDRLRDYESALAGYMKVKHMYPQSSVMDQVDKRIIACLERLQRTADARQALSEAASVDPAPADRSRPGEVVARIGDQQITSGDLEFRISQLPEYIRTEISTRERKREFLQQLVATELFYEAARRQELDRDKDVTAGVFEAKKSLMVQKYLENEIAADIDISPEDVRLYYDAHRETYTEKDADGTAVRQLSFEEAAGRAAEDLAREKQQRAYQELIGRMIQAEDVHIYDDKIK